MKVRSVFDIVSGTLHSAVYGAKGWVTAESIAKYAADLRRLAEFRPPIVLHTVEIADLRKKGDSGQNLLHQMQQNALLLHFTADLLYKIQSGWRSSEKCRWNLSSTTNQYKLVFSSGTIAAMAATAAL